MNRSEERTNKEEYRSKRARAMSRSTCHLMRTLLLVVFVRLACKQKHTHTHTLNRTKTKQTHTRSRNGDLKMNESPNARVVYSVYLFLRVFALS